MPEFAITDFSLTQMYDFRDERWETPVPIDPKDKKENPLGCSKDMLYNVHLITSEGMIVVRRGTNESNIPV